MLHRRVSHSAGRSPGRQGLDPTLAPHRERVTKRLDGRIALVTGASRGLGAAVAKRYAAEGAQVILLARNLKGLEQTDDEIRRSGASATLVPLDLRQFDQLDAMGAALHQRFGRIDVL